MKISNSTNNISIYAQGNKLEKMYSTKSDLKFVKNEMVWESEITPSLLSKIYTIRINYTLGKPPIIRVVSEKLLRLENEKLPHVYSDKKQQLCLYYPKNNEWNGNMYIAETIVPWASEWLYFYENWLITGEWHGGGVHPEDSKKKEKFSNYILKKCKIGNGKYS
jgi:hypothetical protein